MKTFCTIITADYLPLAKVLFASLQKFDAGSQLQVLVVDRNNISSAPGFTIHTTDTLTDQPFAAGIKKKYAHTNKDYYRWALKPVFIGYLLQKGFTKVIFTDPDICFVSNFDFLFAELDSNNILLTPHWANLDPVSNEDSLLAVLKGGSYNAGFIGASSKGIDAISFWASLCHYKTEDLRSHGLFVDQKYLDILPAQFKGVKVIQHQGCNLASWNIDTCKREMVAGQLRINKVFEPVFIHYSRDTIVNILNQNDRLLHPYLDEYINVLNKEGFDLLKNTKEPGPAAYQSAFYSIKHRLRIRTRIKRFFFLLAEKL